MATEGYIRYRAEYKYQLAYSYKMTIPVRPSSDIETEFIHLNTHGDLLVEAGYAWDGPVWPSH